MPPSLTSRQFNPLAFSNSYTKQIMTSTPSLNTKTYHNSLLAGSLGQLAIVGGVDYESGAELGTAQPQLVSLLNLKGKLSVIATFLAVKYNLLILSNDIILQWAGIYKY